MEASRRASRVGSVVGYLKMLTNVQAPLSGVRGASDLALRRDSARFKA
jgi:hypothetical protein